jgi:hypothetical protein
MRIRQVGSPGYLTWFAPDYQLISDTGAPVGVTLSDICIKHETGDLPADGWCVLERDVAA